MCDVMLEVYTKHKRPSILLRQVSPLVLWETVIILEKDRVRGEMQQHQ